MSTHIQEKKNRWIELIGKAKAISAGAEALGRSMTNEECDATTRFLAEAKQLKAEIDNTTMGRLTGNVDVSSPLSGGRDASANSLSRMVKSLGATGWIDAKGNQVDVLRKGESMVDLVQARNPDVDVESLSLGRWLRGRITGNWKGAHAEAELMSALGEGLNTSGGYLVPEVLSARVIDMARARSVLLLAGAQIIPMTSDTLLMGKIAADPTFTTKTENAAWDPTDITFGAIELHARTLGGLLEVSRELMDDAPNMPTLLEQVLANALAVEIDRQGLVGEMGATEIPGLATRTGVQTITSVGAMTWDDILDAIEDLELVNGYPNAYILHPSENRTLRGLKVNSEANHYATMPPDVAGLLRLPTMNIDDGTCIVGDFTKMLIGVRLSPEIMVSAVSGDAFKKFQVHLRAVWRGDFNCERSNHFDVLTGCT